MTQPQNDPATDIGAALARLAEQTVALQRQVGTLRQELAEQNKAIQMQIEALDRLTDAKFITFRTLVDANSEKVALALSASDKAIDKAQLATDKAIDKAQAANDERFKSVNEFRSQLNDQARTFMPRSEAEAIVNRNTQRIEEMIVRVQEMMPRTEATAALTRTTERIQEITDRLNRREGSDKGAKDNRTGIYAAIAALGVVITIIVVLANAWAGR